MCLNQTSWLTSSELGVIFWTCRQMASYQDPNLKSHQAKVLLDQAILMAHPAYAPLVSCFELWLHLSMWPCKLAAQAHLRPHFLFQEDDSFGLSGRGTMGSLWSWLHVSGPQLHPPRSCFSSVLPRFPCLSLNLSCPPSVLILTSNGATKGKYSLGAAPQYSPPSCRNLSAALVYILRTTRGFSQIAMTKTSPNAFWRSIGGLQVAHVLSGPRTCHSHWAILLWTWSKRAKWWNKKF